MKNSRLKLRLKFRQARHYLLFYIELALHNISIPFCYRKERNRMKIQAMFDKDLKCRSFDCFFNHSGRCRNPQAYWGKESSQEILSCSNGMWKDGNR